MQATAKTFLGVGALGMTSRAFAAKGPGLDLAPPEPPSTSSIYIWGVG